MFVISAGIVIYVLFFFSVGAGDMIQVHHTLHRFFFYIFLW